MQCEQPRRRAFVTFLGGSAAAWTLEVYAQSERVRRVGVLIAATAEDPEYQARLGAFVKGMNDLGWIEGRNLRFEIHYAKPIAADIRKHAAELVAATPDVVFTSGGTVTGPFLQASRTIPVVFTSVVDPVGGGFVESLARPGGNATGFMQFEYSLAGKWLELLKQIAPNTTRAAVIRDATTTAGVGQFAVIQSVAPSLGVDVVLINVRDAGQIESAIGAFARTPNGGLIATSGAAVNAHHDLIIRLAARHQLPATYARRSWVGLGGLVSYGPDVIVSARLAAGYIDRILKGAKPADLPVQAPTKYELVVNLKTAKALGISVPGALLARADAVIE